MGRLLCHLLQYEKIYNAPIPHALPNSGPQPLRLLPREGYVMRHGEQFNRRINWAISRHNVDAIPDASKRCRTTSRDRHITLQHGRLRGRRVLNTSHDVAFTPSHFMPLRPPEVSDTRTMNQVTVTMFLSLWQRDQLARGTHHFLFNPTKFTLPYQLLKGVCL